MATGKNNTYMSKKGKKKGQTVHIHINRSLSLLTVRCLWPPHPPPPSSTHTHPTLHLGTDIQTSIQADRPKIVCLWSYDSSVGMGAGGIKAIYRYKPYFQRQFCPALFYQPHHPHPQCLLQRLLQLYQSLESLSHMLCVLKCSLSHYLYQTVITAAL